MISGTCKISLEGSSESRTLIHSWESINQHNLSGKQLGNIYQDPKYVLTHCLVMSLLDLIQKMQSIDKEVLPRR